MTKIKDSSWYEGREQTWVKHFMLATYLERWAQIVGPSFGSLTYVDGFAGPWESDSEKLEDTSPGIVVDLLRDARETLRRRRAQISVRAMFIEQDARGVERLRSALQSAKDIELEFSQREFEDLVPEAVKFAKPDGFCFTFIDPCGWKGLNLARITPLLRVRPGEVLVNFMTDYINRFIDTPDPETASQFEALFGSTRFREAWANLKGEERQEAIVAKYCERLREEGRFSHVVSAEVVKPRVDRPYFHLVYATRDDMGLKVFRDTERVALKKQGAVRADAEQRKRESSGQKHLFRIADYAQDHYIAQRCARYRRRAAEVIAKETPVGVHVPYRRIAVAAMQLPTVADQDVKDILKEQQKAGRVQFCERLDGATFTELGSRRVVQWDRQHFVRRVQEHHP